jgi:hypothetical protein
MKMKHLILILSVFFSVNLCMAQKSMLKDTDMHKVIITGLDKMYNFEFDSAKVIYLKVKEKYPDHPAYNFLIASNLYWEMLLNDNYKEHTDEYFELLNACLKQANKFLNKDSKDVEGIFFNLAVESSLALYYAERDENMKALSHVKKAYASMKEGFYLKEKYVEFYFSTGLYNYFVVKYPEANPIFKPFMFFFTKGDKEKGLKELEYCSQNGIFSPTESLHYLANIYLKYENKPDKALIYSSQLAQKYPDNYYFITRHTESLIATGKYKEAEIYAYKLFKTGKKPFIMRSYVFYGLLNEKHFKDPDKAISYYLNAVKLAKELLQPTGDFLSFAYAGLARVYHQKGNTSKAIEYYKKATETAEYTSISKEAEEYLDKYD